MRLKGIAFFAFLVAALSGAASLEESIMLAPGSGANRLSPPGSGSPGALAISPTGPAAVSDPVLGGWQVDNAVAVAGFRGGTDLVLAPAAYRRTDDTDLLLHFDAMPVDEGGRWSIEAGRQFAIETGRSALGPGSASFRGSSSALKLIPGRGALLSASSTFRDFTIEFWLWPASAANGETVLSWQSLRPLAGGSQSQSLSCSVAGGRLRWDFQGFFEPPSMTASPAPARRKPSAATPLPAPPTTISLRATSPLVPHAWSHHLIRFDADTGLLEYLVDGVTEAVAYATSTGHEGGATSGEVWVPAIGAASPLVLAPGFAGLVDEFRISRSFVDQPSLKAYGRDGGMVLSPVADLGIENSRLISVEVQAKTPGATGIELSYRIAEEWIGWRYDNPAWIPFRAGENLPSSARGRYVQVRVELYPDGTGKTTPSLSSITLHFEPDPLPPPPAHVQAIAKDGAIELRWSRVPEADVAGYLVYYGAAPGDYFGTGAAEGPSPIDAGNVTSFSLTGLPNGSLVYVAIAARDAASLPGSPARRAGEFSAEVSARPSRTAR